MIESLLEKKLEAKIDLKASRKGDKIAIQANVSGLKKGGDELRLRVLLVEEVEYKGRNGLARQSTTLFGTWQAAMRVRS
jgi:hypothetical protein